MTSLKKSPSQPQSAPAPRRAAAPPSGVPRSRRALEALAAEAAALKLEEVRLAAELDVRLRLAREALEPQLARVRDALAVKTAAARAWAEAHPEAFGERRSLELSEAFLGWRSAPPSLKPLDGWTWERVTVQLKTRPEARAYLRVREEPNKIRLLSDRIALGDDGLAVLGLRVAQDDTFYLEPRLESTAVAGRAAQAA